MEPDVFYNLLRRIQLRKNTTRRIKRKMRKYGGEEPATPPKGGQKESGIREKLKGGGVGFW